MKKLTLMVVLLFFCYLTKATDTTQTKVFVIHFNDSAFSYNDRTLNYLPFSLETDGFFNIIYTPYDSVPMLKITADEKVVNQIRVEEFVENGKNILKISHEKTAVPHQHPPTIVLYANNLKGININSASKFTTSNPIRTKSFTVNSSGASNIVINGNIDHLTTNASGASNVIYSGHAKNHHIVSSGAATVYASKQTNDTATLSASGVSKIRVYVKDKILSQNCNSYASIIVLGRAETYTEKEVTIVYNNQEGNHVYHTDDTTTFKLLGIDFTKVGNYLFEIGMGCYSINTDGDKVYLQSRKGRKFNGHWGGIELGFNGYNTQNFNMDFPKDYKYMDLKTSKSITFHLNLLEFNIPFTKRPQKWGMVTGLGYEVYNYRFQNNVFLCHDSTSLKGYIVSGGLPVRSKLVVDYLTIPLLFEFQNKDFHINLGGIFGLRLTTHTKMKFEKPNETVFLNDPETGTTVATLIPGQKIYKQHDDFHLNPIKLNARFSIGYKILNVFVDYSIIHLFRANGGPTLYPWSIGFALVGW